MLRICVVCWMVAPYARYDENTMGKFLLIDTSTSDKSEGGDEEFVREVVNDTAIKVVDLEHRRDVGKALFDCVELFLDLGTHPEVLSHYHVGQPGVGKSFYLKRCVTVLPQFFDGLAAAFVSLGRLKESAFASPPHPEEILAMAKEKSPNVNKLFVIYDDFEVCYSKPWGPSLTQSVFNEMDQPDDVFVHVLGSSQWIGDLLNKSLPKSRPLFIDQESRFGEYSSCSSFRGRCTEFEYGLQPCINEESFTKLFVSIFQQYQLFDPAPQVGESEEEHWKARQSLYWMYWLTGGNARKVVSLAVMFRRKKVTAYNPHIQLNTKEVLNFLTGDRYKNYSHRVFEVMEEFIGKLEEENEPPPSVASMVDISMVEKILKSGSTFGDIGDLMKYNYWTLRGVPMDKLSFGKQDVFELVDAGVLMYDSEKEILHAGTPSLLIWFAMYRDEVKKEEKNARTEILQDKAGRLIGEVLADVIKNSAFWKIQTLVPAVLV